MNNYVITALPAFKDNYIWIIHNSVAAIVVDPGESGGVERFLAQHDLALAAILVTHSHNDHCGGVAALHRAHPDAVIYDNFQHTLGDGDIILIGGFAPIEIITTPGHTVEHVVFLFDQKHLFCGDTLFAMGCGRVFTGDFVAMYNSLNKIKKLAPQVLCYPAHEYTTNNLRFTTSIDKNSGYYQDLANYILMQLTTTKMSLPTTIEQELEYNLFLRCQDSKVWTIVSEITKHPIANELECFIAIRELRNEF